MSEFDTNDESFDTSMLFQHSILLCAFVVIAAAPAFPALAGTHLVPKMDRLGMPTSRTEADHVRLVRLFRARYWKKWRDPWGPSLEELLSHFQELTPKQRAHLKSIGSTLKRRSKHLLETSRAQVYHFLAGKREQVHGGANWSSAGLSTVITSAVDTGQNLSRELIQQINYEARKGLPNFGMDYKRGGKKVSDLEIVGEARVWDLGAGGLPFLKAEDTWRSLDLFMDWYNESHKRLHPIELAALAMQRFISFHPFADGNGRTMRAISDFILLRNGYIPPAFDSKKSKPYPQIQLLYGVVYGDSPRKVVLKLIESMERTLAEMHDLR